MFSAQELQAIDDWRFAKRIGTRAGAVRRLLHIGLTFSDMAEKMESLTSDLMRFDPDAAWFFNEEPLPPGSKDHLKKQWELIRQVMQVYEVAAEFSRPGDIEKQSLQAQEARESWSKPTEGDK